jgi:enterochelin esterase-like enzyme
MLKLIYSLLILVSLRSNAFTVDEHIIESTILGYNLRYWVHVPDVNAIDLPVLFVTDGQGYKDNGIIAISESLIKANKIRPHIIVMVSAVDPDKPSLNRRNSQFLCNPKYVEFYREELIPAIEKQYKTSKLQKDRGILGLSFGGLNAMYFALHASDIFGKIGIQSPAPHPCPDIYNDFENSEKLPVDIFLSTGTVNDKAATTRRLKKVLDGKGYSFKYMEVAEGHNWRNWKPMLDDILIYFYKKGA